VPAYAAEILLLALGFVILPLLLRDQSLSVWNARHGHIAYAVLITSTIVRVPDLHLSSAADAYSLDGHLEHSDAMRIFAQAALILRRVSTR
jgi:hypothetical protein